MLWYHNSVPATYSLAFPCTYALLTATVDYSS